MWGAPLPLFADGEDLSTIINYGEQAIDVRSLYGAGPSFRFTIDEDNGNLIWIENTAAGPKLTSVPLVGRSWIESEKKVIGDIGKRSFFSTFQLTSHQSTYFVSDNGHDETFNIYRLNVKNGELTKITNSQYIAAFGISEAAKIFVYQARKNKFVEENCLEELSLDGRIHKELLCDTDGWKHYGYENPIVSDDGRYIALTVMIGLDRSRQNLLLFDRQTNSHRILTDASLTRGKMVPVAFAKEGILFVSNEGERVPSLWQVPLEGGGVRKVISNEMSMMDAQLLADDGVMIVQRLGAQDGFFELYDLDTLTRLASENTKGGRFYFGLNFHKAGSKKYAVMGYDGKSKDQVAFSIDVSAEAIAEKKMVVVGMRREGSSQLMKRCDAEEVSYPTFDIDPETNATRLIHAILLKPKVTGHKEKAAFVYAHGGPASHVKKLDYDAQRQLLCVLGYTVIAANVRGSTGRGQAFMDLNNGDWGGGDYLDYEYARRYLVKEYGIPEDRIGIVGGSFGGYMVNWAMTRPDNKFAVGISDFGYADLFHMVRNSVIPANQVSDLGHPDDFPDLYRDRSPINYVEYMNKPLLLTHGSNDWRTPTEGTRIFYAALKELGKDVDYLELPDEGHGYMYLDSNIKHFGRITAFLWENLPLVKN